MIDQLQAEQNTGNQEAPMPSAQEPIQPDAQVQDAPQEGSVQSTQEGLPADASDRTRNEFEKLRNQLREERVRRETLEQTFKTFQPQPAPVVRETPKPFIDPETGFLNEDRLTAAEQRAIDADTRAKQAEESLKSYLLEQEKREAFTAHPELNPEKSGFDQNLSNLTRSILTDSMLNPQDYGGKALSFKEAADRVKGLQKPVLEQAKKEGAQQALEQLTPKEQAALAANGVPNQQSSTRGDLSQLQYRTRKGDVDAIHERMKGVPWG